MKQYFFLLIVNFIVVTAFAQKKTYFLFAHAKKRTEQICGEKELINSGEVSLTTEEAGTYKQKYLTQLQTKYNSANGYEYVYVELVPPEKIIIYYEGEKTYDQKKDGWNCTSTFYDCQTAPDFLTAENKIAAMKAEYKTSVYTNFKRWEAPIMQSEKADDLAIRWVQTKTKVVAFITNTRKDAALKVTIKSFKNTGGSLSVEGGFQKAKQVETHTMVLQPGARWQQNLENADGFEIDTAPDTIIKEEQGIINNIKQRIRLYITDPKANQVKACCGGVRG
jgi:hypothetical protein